MNHYLDGEIKKGAVVKVLKTQGGSLSFEFVRNDPLELENPNDLSRLYPDDVIGRVKITKDDYFLIKILTNKSKVSNELIHMGAWEGSLCLTNQAMDLKRKLAVIAALNAGDLP